MNIFCLLMNDLCPVLCVQKHGNCYRTAEPRVIFHLSALANLDVELDSRQTVQAYIAVC